MTNQSHVFLPSALFIVVEGGDGSGKTTLSKSLAARLGALWTREPGGTDLGLAIRELCLGTDHDPAPVAELLLMAADRAHHVATLINPTLAIGRSVVDDRYTYSTIAYQGAGRGVDKGLLDQVTQIAACGREPDVVLVINVSAEVATARLNAFGSTDRMEQVDAAFTQRVRQSYLDQASLDPRARVIDGSGTEEEVLASALSVLSEMFPWLSAASPKPW
jgi:dTMP kinase